MECSRESHTGQEVSILGEFLRLRLPIITSVTRRPSSRQPTLVIKSPFLSLPIEIRLLIYNYVFQPTPTHAAALLATCRTIYNEAAPVFYSATPFHLPCGFTSQPFIDWPTQFLTQIGATNRSYIRSLAITWDRDLQNCNADILPENRALAPPGMEKQSKPGNQAWYRLLYPTQVYVAQCDIPAACAWRMCRTLNLILWGCHQLDMLEIVIPAVSDWDGPVLRALDFLHRTYGDQDVCEVLGKIQVRRLFRFGLTLDFVLVEKIAREMGVKRVEMFWGNKCQILDSRCFAFRNLLKSHPEREVEGWATWNPNGGIGDGAFKVLIG